MPVKQVEKQICHQCERTITFPEGEVRTACKCGATWEIGDAGFWEYVQGLKVKKDKKSRYERAERRRKAARTC